MVCTHLHTGFSSPFFGIVGHPGDARKEFGEIRAIAVSRHRELGIRNTRSSSEHSNWGHLCRLSHSSVLVLLDIVSITTAVHLFRDHTFLPKSQNQRLNIPSLDTRIFDRA
jgi:hypothetical protein